MSQFSTQNGHYGSGVTHGAQSVYNAAHERQRKIEGLYRRLRVAESLEGNTILCAKLRRRINQLQSKEV